MMAVICFCLRPHANNRAVAFRQLGCYIWVPPPENPQGLELLYVCSLFIGKRKMDGSAGVAVENGRLRAAQTGFVVRKSPRNPGPKNRVMVPVIPNRVPSPCGLRGPAISRWLRKKSG